MVSTVRWSCIGSGPQSFDSESLENRLPQMSDWPFYWPIASALLDANFEANVPASRLCCAVLVGRHRNQTRTRLGIRAAAASPMIFQKGAGQITRTRQNPRTALDNVPMLATHPLFPIRGTCSREREKKCTFSPNLLVTLGAFTKK